jgi:hypothetical protein
MREGAAVFCPYRIVHIPLVLLSTLCSRTYASL